jgi:hypothetical protein
MKVATMESDKLKDKIEFQNLFLLMKVATAEKKIQFEIADVVSEPFPSNEGRYSAPTNAQ